MRSWVPGANDPDGDFPLANLPCGVFSHAGGEPRCGVAIGDFVLDVCALEEAGVLDLGGPYLDVPFWNEVMEAGPAVWAALRERLTGLLAEGADAAAVAGHLVPLGEVTLHLPFLVAEYTDFYAGRHHALNVGTMLRGAENALPPNWDHIPIGYNGRASSVVVSGTDVRRPWGQVKPPEAAGPEFRPSRRFDFELELGAVVGIPSEGMVSVDAARSMIFGHVLLNDWSARDIQGWEYQPLGPFQSKATATTISPWIVTALALEAFRAPGAAPVVPLLPHLREEDPGLYDIALEVELATNSGAAVVSRTNVRELSYSAAQQLCHHTTSGCPMNAGDLLGSGTISGPLRENRGSMLELSWGGKEPLDVAGTPRSFLEDGDQVVFRGRAQGAGYRLGFGECRGRVIPAHGNPAGAGR
jgi:fumarylacetoacetase